MNRELAAAMRGDDRVLRSHPYDPNDPFWRAAATEAVDLLVADAAARTAVQWPAQSSARMRQLTLDAWVVDTSRTRELQRVLDRLASVGVSCLVIKGAALAATVYPQPHLRRRCDTDLLIDVADVDRLTETLVGDGYLRAVEQSGALATSQRHFDRAAPVAGLHALDVHWRVANPRVFDAGLAYADFSGSAAALPAFGPHGRTPSLANALLLACIHRVAHHNDAPDLLWLWDIHLLAERLSPSDVEQFVERASRSATRLVCARGLELAGEYFPTPNAVELSSRLRAAAAISTPEPTARLVGGGLRQFDILREDLRALAGWRARVALVRQHLVPPLEYMRAMYGRWPAALLPLAYVDRVVRGVRKWFRRPGVGTTR